MRRSVDQRMTRAGVLPGLGLLAAVAIGSLWTAAAVVDGSVASMLLRFAVSVGAAFYYLVMYRVATGRGLTLR